MTDDIKEKITKWVNDIDTFKKTDEVCKNLRKTIIETGDKIGYSYAKIHNEEYGSQDELNNLMMTISELAQEKREAEKEYKDLMLEKFGDFKEDYENIYELATSEEGIDKQTLNHVFSVYNQYQNKHINLNQGVNRGIDYMKTKFSLPDDFLTKLPENE